MQHDLGLLLATVVICSAGCLLTVRLAMRMRAQEQPAQRIALILPGFVGGGTIFVTHFVAMLSYDPGMDHGYVAFQTLASLAIGLVGVTLSLFLATKRGLRLRTIIAGICFGLTVSAMHFTGMAGYVIPGDIVWQPDMVVMSVLAGIGFGIVCFHRIMRPVTRYCWLGATVAMIAAICSMHFLGMAAMDIAHNHSAAIPRSPLSDTALAIIAVISMIVVMLMGLSAFLIELQLEGQSHSRLRRAGLTDPLTNLPNRPGLHEKLSACRADIRAGVYNRMALLTIDLDGFKHINDAVGHSGGDRVLKLIAARIEQVIQPDEYLARTAGDEFVAIKTGYNDLAEVHSFADRLRAEIERPLPHLYIELALTVSIGLSSLPEDGNDIEFLQNNSDFAMHQAKNNSGGKLCIYQANMQAEQQDRMALVSDLRHAIARNELLLDYQQQNDTKTHQLIGFEALVRWQHPTRGLFSPGQFIPIAEGTAQILEIGEWVLRTAVAEAASWQTPYNIAVNVAPKQLVEQSFVEMVSNILSESKLDPSRLELEITEASIIDDQKNTRKVMEQLKRMGVQIAMDDFGVGYSSLATLQSFPFDKIKIDRSFVKGLHNDMRRAAIVKATLLIGKAFEIRVLAEGVAELDELTFLQELNCAEVQGFYFGKPLSRDEMRNLIDQMPAVQRTISRAS